MTHSQDQQPAAWRPRSTDDLDQEQTTDDDAELRDPEAGLADTELRDPEAELADTELRDPEAGLADTELRDPEAELADTELRNPEAELADTELRDPEAEPAAELDDDIVVAEVIDESPDDLTADGSATAETDPQLPRAPSADVSIRRGGADLSQRWRDIQASFVDDPRGAVRLAAEAADAAVAALVSSLHERQSAILPAASEAGDAHDTEQLRTALRGYRVFCQNIEQIGHQLPVPEPMSS